MSGDSLPGYDDWKTTDPAIESECEECGGSLGEGDHSEDCSVASYEPDFEQIVKDREEAREARFFDL